MRLIHLADLHLGYRQYQRLTPGGVNQREADVAKTFQRTITQVIELKPDAVVIAGDIFSTVRPSNAAILLAYQQFSRLKQALPRAAVVMVAGNHDTPRTSETGGILQLFSRLGLESSELGIEVADREARRVSFDALSLSVLAVPDVPGPPPRFTVDPAYKYNVLVFHGEIRGRLPEHAMLTNPAALQVDPEELGAAAWSYVALGHHHVCTEIYANAFYAGSMEYTSVNVWGELHEERSANLKGKGFIERDLDTGAQIFHPIASARILIDLPPISARNRTVAEIDLAIAEAVQSVRKGIDGKIVRLLVFDLPRHVARELDQKAIRDYKRRALHFHLDARRPERARPAVSGAAGRRPSLSDVVRDGLLSRSIEADVDRGTLVALGMRYLRAAEELESSVPGLTPE